MAEITSVLEKETSAHTNSTSGFDFDHITQFAVCINCCWIDHLLRKYDVICIFLDGGSDRLILLLVSYLLISLPAGGQNLSANQISSTYLNWRLRCNYFRFWKTNVHHFVSLLPVVISHLDHFAVICMLFYISLLNFGALIADLISSTSPQLTCFLHQATKFRPNGTWEHSLRKYDVISISQDGGHNR